MQRSHRGLIVDVRLAVDVRLRVVGLLVVDALVFLVRIVLAIAVLAARPTASGVDQVASWLAGNAIISMVGPIM
jgi:hypothetical protein